MENEFTINAHRVLELFFVFPSRMYSARELARITGLSHPTVLEALHQFEKAHIIVKEIQQKQFGIRKSVFWRANSLGEKYKMYKKLANIQRLSLSYVVKEIALKTSPNAIVLFGSYSRGEDTEQSDIDLFVQSTEKELALKKFEKQFGRRINILFESDLRKIKKELLNNIINGIVLYGYLEVLK